jgi:hypothetical protein
MTTARERWVFTVEVPPGIPNSGRLVARWLKYGLRALGLRCSAVIEAPSEAEATNPPDSPLASILDDPGASKRQRRNPS